MTGSDKMGNKSIFKITIYTLNLIDQEYKRNKLDNQIKIIVIRVKSGKTVSPVPPDGNEDGFQKTEAQPEPDISFFGKEYKIGYSTQWNDKNQV